MSNQRELIRYCGKCCRPVEKVEDREHLYSCGFCEELRATYETLRGVNAPERLEKIKLKQRPMGEFL